MKRQFTRLFLGSLFAIGATQLCAQEQAVPAPVASLPAAQDSGTTLNSLYENEWVVLDANNQVQGSLVQLSSNGALQGVSGVTVTLTRGGTPIQTVTTANDGAFTLNGLGTGTYALVAKSPNTVAAFAFHVLPQGSSTVLDSKFTVIGTTIGQSAVMEVLRPNLVPGVSEANYVDLKADPLGDARRVLGGHQIQLGRGGLISGSVSRMNGRNGRDLAGNVVSILRNGQIVAHALTNAAGEFQLTGIAPGVHDFVIGGKDGMAAGSFEAVNGPGVAGLVNPQVKLVAAVAQASELLNIELIPTSDWFAGSPEQVAAGEGLVPVPGAGMVGPNAMSGSSGGGGGGGGGGLGGGMGGLLGVAGLAAGAVALAANDSGFDTPPATQVTP